MNIRASMLPNWNDCARRAAAKQYPRLLAEHGFELRRLAPSVGAAVGTAVHKAAATMLRARMNEGAIRDGSEGGLDAAMEGALASFRQEIQTGAEWDATTPNAADAERQIASLARAYAPLIAESEPVLVEALLKAAVGNGWELTGTLDLYTSAGHVDDLKTGALPRPHMAQTGAYALLLEANDHPVRSAGITFIKRVRAAKPQPAPIRREHDVQVAKRVAFSTAHAIIEGMERFADGPRRGSPYTIPANPMSLMCSRKYCPAWGTGFCREHEPAPPSKEE